MEAPSVLRGIRIVSDPGGQLVPLTSAIGGALATAAMALAITGIALGSSGVGKRGVSTEPAPSILYEEKPAAFARSHRLNLALTAGLSTVMVGLLVSSVYALPGLLGWILAMIVAFVVILQVYSTSRRQRFIVAPDWIQPSYRPMSSILKRQNLIVAGRDVARVRVHMPMRADLILKSGEEVVVFPPFGNKDAERAIWRFLEQNELTAARPRLVKLRQ